MIQPAKYDLYVPQGATFDRTLTLELDGEPVNLTGYTAAMDVRKEYESVTATLELTNLSGIQLGGNTGTITIGITASQTAAIIAGNYKYDLELTAPDGTVTRLIYGDFIVSREVTR